MSPVPTSSEHLLQEAVLAVRWVWSSKSKADLPLDPDQTAVALSDAFLAGGFFQRLLSAAYGAPVQKGKFEIPADQRESVRFELDNGISVGLGLLGMILRVGRSEYEWSCLRDAFERARIFVFEQMNQLAAKLGHPNSELMPRQLILQYVNVCPDPGFLSGVGVEGILQAPIREGEAGISAGVLQSAQASWLVSSSSPKGQLFLNVERRQQPEAVEANIEFSTEECSDFSDDDFREWLEQGHELCRSWYQKLRGK